MHPQLADGSWIIQTLHNNQTKDCNSPSAFLQKADLIFFSVYPPPTEMKLCKVYFQDLYRQIFLRMDHDDQWLSSEMPIVGMWQAK